MARRDSDRDGDDPKSGGAGTPDAVRALNEQGGGVNLRRRPPGNHYYDRFDPAAGVSYRATPGADACRWMTSNRSSRYQLTPHRMWFGSVENVADTKYYTFGAFSPTASVFHVRVTEATNPRAYSPRPRSAPLLDWNCSYRPRDRLP